MIVLTNCLLIKYIFGAECYEADMARSNDWTVCSWKKCAHWSSLIYLSIRISIIQECVNKTLYWK